MIASMKLSVIVPYYMNRDMLRYQLTYWRDYGSAVEIIVVDDGSRVGSRAESVLRDSGVRVKLYHVLVRSCQIRLLRQPRPGNRPAQCRQSRLRHVRSRSRLLRPQLARKRAHSQSLKQRQTLLNLSRNNLNQRTRQILPSRNQSQKRHVRRRLQRNLR